MGAITTGSITEEDVKEFYSGTAMNHTGSFSTNSSSFVHVANAQQEKTDGSNGFAIAPSRTQNGHAILYINPHTTFYFRPEVHMISKNGLNAYGAVTWGQFFIYQGFNSNCGWMHTSSSADVSDMYSEKITKLNNRFYYKYNNQWLPVTEKKMALQYKDGNTISKKTIITYFTHHGPVMAQKDGQLISVKANNRDMNGLIQSWLRTKAKGFDEYKKIMEMRVNTSNNTVFADKSGNIAYWHGNFMPKRDPKFNWGKVVDGTTKATEWKGLHQLDEIVHVYNPSNGWIQNCNSTPFTVSGNQSPLKSNYPVYMAPDGENFRGINAVRVLEKENKFTIDKIIAAGYDTYLTAFEILIPALLKAHAAAGNDSLAIQLNEPIALLKQWDYRVAEESVATALAIEWAQLLGPQLRKVYIEDGETDQVQTTQHFAANATPDQLLKPLGEVIRLFQQRYGSWNVAWGQINRYQRVSNEIRQKYDDAKESVPVAFASSAWGMLPAYNSNYYPGTVKRYGTSGNSFVCAVEFGPHVRAKSLLAGGVSGNIQSPHFKDQLVMYTKGQFKEVLYYKEDVLKHKEQSYHPGE